MLYKYNVQRNIEKLPYYSIKDIKGLEKDLENLLAKNLTELYSEEGQLMPIFQERKRQPEPDLCALDREGNLVIFELKREKVSGDTTIQVMRYCQDYGRKNYFELSDLYKKYTCDENSNLKEAHKEAFGLDVSLGIEEFNRKQKLIIIGSSTDTNLMGAVDYWRGKGVDIDYIPYRVYKINDELYFEFFAKPYDYHVDIGKRKGILFDTNSTYGPNDIWDMFANSKVSAYGSIKGCINSFNKGDYVFYYHKGWGVVGAGTIKSAKPIEIEAKEELYLNVDLITPKVQCEDQLRYISPSELRELLNKNFYFAKTTKVPYLSKEESEKVVKLLKEKYGL